MVCSVRILWCRTGTCTCWPCTTVRALASALIPLSVDGMIVAASLSLLLDSRLGRRGGFLPWALLIIGALASLAANIAVAEPAMAGRVIAAWPSFALTASYELLMRQVRHAAVFALQRPGGGIAGPPGSGYCRAAPGGSRPGKRRERVPGVSGRPAGAAAQGMAVGAGQPAF